MTLGFSPMTDGKFEDGIFLPPYFLRCFVDILMSVNTIAIGFPFSIPPAEFSPRQIDDALFLKIFFFRSACWDNFFPRVFCFRGVALLTDSCLSFLFLVNFFQNFMLLS